MNPKAFIKCVATALLALPLISGCGSKSDPGADIAITVKPNAEVLINPGDTTTCVDLLNAKISNGAVLSKSASGPSLKFNAFLLNWNSVDALYVSAIRYTVEGQGITGGKMEGTLPTDEMYTLLGITNGVIARNAGPITINSSDTTRSIPCGFTIGGVTLTDGNKTKTFKAKVTIEIIGSAENSDQALRFVKQKYQATAMYYGS